MADAPDLSMSKEDQTRLGLVAGTAFSPGAPVRHADVFAGRKAQIRRVIDAISQHGKSVLIYGERGVGKTSLANVIDEIYLSIAKARVFVPHIACDSEDTFHQIWTKVIAEKDRTHSTARLPENASAAIDAIVDSAAGAITPHHVKLIADEVTRTHLMIPIIDEFDRIKDPYAIALFTDTVKYLSDHTQNTTLIIVGVGDTIDDLIKEHQSVERALEQVLMPRMSAQESREILTQGEAATRVRFSENAARLIVSLAQGLPHYTHVLGLNSTRVAIDAASWTVRDEHVEEATTAAIEGSLQSLKRAHHTATTSPRADNLFRQVLLACALARTDDLGYFAAADVRDPLTRIMGKPYDIPNYSQHLKLFCEPERGAMLQRTGPKNRTRFRFSNPLIQPFIVMMGLRDGNITKDDVLRTASAN
ncbi:hypothetical protein BH11PLA1_BH11PLA1_11910 [soil metagenome]